MRRRSLLWLLGGLTLTVLIWLRPFWASPVMASTESCAVNYDPGSGGAWVYLSGVDPNSGNGMGLINTNFGNVNYFQSGYSAVSDGATLGEFFPSWMSVGQTETVELASGSSPTSVQVTCVAQNATGVPADPASPPTTTTTAPPTTTTTAPPTTTTTVPATTTTTQPLPPPPSATPPGCVYSQSAEGASTTTSTTDPSTTTTTPPECVELDGVSGGDWEALFLLIGLTCGALVASSWVD